MLSLLLMMACSSGAKDQKGADCATITDSKQQNTCLHEQLLSMPASDISKIIELANTISDPMIRQAAVSKWIKEHNNDVNQQQGQQLCTLLDGRDRSYCLRQLSSPHLRR